MPAMTFELGSYSIQALTGEDQPVYVHLWEMPDRYRGYICFHPHFTGNFTWHDRIGIVNAFMPPSKLDVMLDILRNEKPVYLTVSEEHNVASLRTGKEPPGEEEGS